MESSSRTSTAAPRPDRKLRVLFVAGALRGGGAERQLHGLLSAIHSLGHHVVAATLDPHSEAQAFEVIPLRNAIPRRRSTTALQLVRACATLRLVIRRSRPDAIVTWLAMPTILSVAIRPGLRIPIIVAVRNSVPERVRSIPDVISRRLLRTAFDSARLVIANSAAGLDTYRHLGILGHGRADVIPNSIDRHRFRPPTDQEREDARKSLGLAHDDRVVAYVGRDAPEKRIALLAEVLRELSRRDPAVRVIVAGVGSLARPGASQLPLGMQAIARVDAIERIYWACDALVLTSESEGSPNVVHEARACGAAIVSTDCGDVRETMLPQDRISPAHPEALTQSLLEVLASRGSTRTCPRSLTPTECALRWIEVIGGLADRGLADSAPALGPRHERCRRPDP